MEKYKQFLLDALFTFAVLAIAFILNLLLNYLFDTVSLIPMLFVLGVFIISLRTHHFLWGIAASLIGVLLVNYAFTYPYYGIDLVSPDCIVSALVMLAVAILTGTLTVKIRKTEKIKAEIEKESMRANLLRAVSHDLRTPLTTVYGSCSAIMENYDCLSKADQLQLLGEIRQDAQWLIRMVENLLSVTRIDGQKVHLKKTPTVLEEFVDAVLQKFRKRCPNVTVLTQIPEDFVSIPMDALLMEQVLINILENAVDHGKGMTELHLRVTLDKDLARFEIRDNGCGIDPEILPNLFTGYLDRRNNPSDGSRSNMGIGLSVCASIVRAHGSEITAENIPSGGAAFKFSLKAEGSNE